MRVRSVKVIKLLGATQHLGSINISTTSICKVLTRCVLHLGLKNGSEDLAQINKIEEFSNYMSYQMSLWKWLLSGCNLMI